jgi:hypothetical protein
MIAMMRTRRCGSSHRINIAKSNTHRGLEVPKEGSSGLKAKPCPVEMFLA